MFKKGKRSKKTTLRQPSTDELCTFAFRLTKDQRDLIHAAAGRGNATQFVLRAALDAAAKATPVG